MKQAHSWYRMKNRNITQIKKEGPSLHEKVDTLRRWDCLPKIHTYRSTSLCIAHSGFLSLLSQQRVSSETQLLKFCKLLIIYNTILTNTLKSLIKVLVLWKKRSKISCGTHFFAILLPIIPKFELLHWNNVLSWNKEFIFDSHSTKKVIKHFFGPSSRLRYFY